MVRRAEADGKITSPKSGQRAPSTVELALTLILGYRRLNFSDTQTLVADFFFLFPQLFTTTIHPPSSVHHPSVLRTLGTLCTVREVVLRSSSPNNRTHALREHIS